METQEGYRGLRTSKKPTLGQKSENHSEEQQLGYVAGSTCPALSTVFHVRLLRAHAEAFEQLIGFSEVHTPIPLVHQNAPDHNSNTLVTAR